MQDNKLSKRLLWIADRVRENILLYDVGTDHAKLPAYLLDNKRITSSVASDIHKGPLDKAQTFINVCGYKDYIKLVLADGLTGIEIKPPCDIAICGMGGETIVNILSAEEDIRDKNVRLLLQPMTDFAYLRGYLSENGFAIVDEDIVFSDDREYQCIVAEFTGEKYTLTDTEKELGKLCIEKRGEVFLQYVERKIKMLDACIAGKGKAAIDTSFEESLRNEYKKILEGNYETFGTV